MLSARSAINNSIFRRHLNGRVWMNDPDVFFLRKDNLRFSDEQKYLLGRINNLCGNVLFISDNAADYDKKTGKLLKKFFQWFFSNFYTSIKNTKHFECLEDSRRFLEEFFEDFDLKDFRIFLLKCRKSIFRTCHVIKMCFITKNTI